LAAISALRKFLHDFRVRRDVHSLFEYFFARDALQHVVDVVAA